MFSIYISFIRYIINILKAKNDNICLALSIVGTKLGIFRKRLIRDLGYRYFMPDKLICIRPRTRWIKKGSFISACHSLLSLVDTWGPRTNVLYPVNQQTNQRNHRYPNCAPIYLIMVIFIYTSSLLWLLRDVWVSVIGERNKTRPISC